MAQKVECAHCFDKVVNLKNEKSNIYTYAREILI